MSKQQLDFILTLSAENPPPANATPPQLREWFEGEATAQKSTEERRTWRFDHGGLDTLFLSADEGVADDLFYEVEYDTRGFGYSSSGELYLAQPSRVVARSGSASVR